MFQASLSGHQSGFCPSILAKRKIRALNCLSPKGESSRPLEQALDGSKTGLDKAKRGLDHIPASQGVNMLLRNKSYNLICSANMLAMASETIIPSIVNVHRLEETESKLCASSRSRTALK